MTSYFLFHLLLSGFVNYVISYAFDSVNLVDFIIVTTAMPLMYVVRVDIWMS